jgi:hypothetical protein
VCTASNTPLYWGSSSARLHEDAGANGSGEHGLFAAKVYYYCSEDREDGRRTRIDSEKWILVVLVVHVTQSEALPGRDSEEKKREGNTSSDIGN